MWRERVGSRAKALIALSLLLAAGGLSVWAAAEQQAASKNTTLTEQEADHIRHTLERLSTNQEQILTALQDIEAELQVVKVRVTR